MRSLCAFILAALLLPACGGNSSPTDPSQVDVEFAAADLVVGTGLQAALGNTVIVDYEGWLYDPSRPDNKGRQFDSSYAGDPIQFRIGLGQLIPGFEQAVLGMREGGKRRVNIPSQLAYGRSGSGTIPPNAALVFEIELLRVTQ